MCNTKIETGKENFKLQSMAGQLFFHTRRKINKMFHLRKDWKLG